MALPHSLTSSQGRSEDWLPVKSPAPPLASAPAAILGSCRLSPPPGICCYGCDCETLRVHRVALLNKEMNHGHALLNAEDAESKIKGMSAKVQQRTKTHLMHDIFCFKKLYMPQTKYICIKKIPVKLFRHIQLYWLQSLVSPWEWRTSFFRQKA